MDLIFDVQLCDREISVIEPIDAFTSALPPYNNKFDIDMFVQLSKEKHLIYPYCSCCGENCCVCTLPLCVDVNFHVQIRDRGNLSHRNRLIKLGVLGP